MGYGRSFSSLQINRPALWSLTIRSSGPLRRSALLSRGARQRPLNSSVRRHSVKVPNRYEVALALLFVSLPVLLVASWGWRASHRGGFPFFSLATLEAIWPWVAFLAICLLGAALSGRESR